MSKRPFEYRSTTSYHTTRFIVLGANIRQARLRLEREYAKYESHRISIWEGEYRIPPSDFEILFPGVGE